jgi:tetraacyldisaccharide 4'-kinase
VLAFEIALERGSYAGPLARVGSKLWGLVAARSVIRRFELPSRTRVVALGGATLGGSGKTPLAIACAAEIASTGARVALVGHAHRARPKRARVVLVDDPLDEVGDEALIAARSLSRAGVAVVVAPSRRAAIEWAARGADVLVLDGVAQTSPTRASLSLLSVDAMEPWGRAGALLPRGDLRAPRDVLLAACDAVVALGDANDDVALGDANDTHEPSDAVWFHARNASRGAQVGECLRTWDELSKVRVGLLCALARPERLIRELEGRGVECRAVVRARDHGPFDARAIARAARAAETAGVDLWLATGKCALHLAHVAADVGLRLRAPLGTIEHSVTLSCALRQRLRAVVAP